MQISMILKYPILTMLSIGKKSFENMGQLIERSGDTVARLLNPSAISLVESRFICKSMFKKRSKLFVIIDDTLIKKIHSKFMQGAGMFFDTKIGKRIMAYRLVAGIITDGKFAIPIDCAYLFAKELIDATNRKFPTKDEIAENFIRTAQKLFPDIKLIILVDGLYATVNFLKWCIDRKISLEARMHSNRVVKYRGKKIKIKNLLPIDGISPCGRQMARTISVVWYEMKLELTIVRRIDKNDDESFVFQIATYKAKPSEHLNNYKKRWPVEKFFRTTKQYLGLQECFSRVFETQQDHVASVFLAYSLAQLDMKKYKLKTPEDALKRAKTRNVTFTINKFARFHKDFSNVHA